GRRSPDAGQLLLDSVTGPGTTEILRGIVEGADGRIHAPGAVNTPSRLGTFLSGITVVRGRPVRALVQRLTGGVDVGFVGRVVPQEEPPDPGPHDHHDDED